MTGQPCCFVRLSGCNLSCVWCDTDHGRFEEMDIVAICNRVPDTVKWVIVTGGEPTRQEITPLVLALRGLGYMVALETNGTGHICRFFDWVSVSPKADHINTPNIRLADEIKIVVTCDTQYFFIQGVVEIARGVVWLQPEGNKPENVKKSMELSRIFDTRVGHQMHKIRGWQ